MTLVVTGQDEEDKEEEEEEEEDEDRDDATAPTMGARWPRPTPSSLGVCR
jgi:hypothetical protein